MTIALVTGSSRGLGAHIARRLAADGFAVAVNALPGDPDVHIVAEQIERTGGVAGGFGADVTDEAQVNRLIADINDRLGPPDVVVFNATGPQPNAPVEDVGWAEHLAQLDYFVRARC